MNESENVVSVSLPTSKKFIDLTGHIYGRLEVLRFAGMYKSPSGNGYSMWHCQCVCGNLLVVGGCGLRTGNSGSCGCLQKERARATYLTHGNSGREKSTQVYRVWKGMRSRTSNHKGKAFPDYGGRGIKVCQRWISSFENFLEDMGHPPTPEHSIDRINNDGDYEPSNCRWATRAEQSRNKRNNRFLDYNGDNLCIADWAKKMGFRRGIIQERIRRGWSIERTLTTPVKKNSH